MRDSIRDQPVSLTEEGALLLQPISFNAIHMQTGDVFTPSASPRGTPKSVRTGGAVRIPFHDGPFSSMMTQKKTISQSA